MKKNDFVNKKIIYFHAYLHTLIAHSSYGYTYTHHAHTHTYTHTLTHTHTHTQMSLIRSIFLYLDRTYVMQSANVASL